MPWMWNPHKEYEGKHALMGASSYHWTNDNEESFERRFYSQYATTIGTAIHELAHDCIVSKTKINKHDINLIKQTLYKAHVPRNAYDPQAILENLVPFVNDCIGFHMSSEILLFYSPFCFGTSDAIGYFEKDKILRVFDYKNGTTAADMRQPYIYCALFCLEYKVEPEKLTDIQCRIYQNQEIVEDHPAAEVIRYYMDLIIKDNKLIGDILEKNGR